jgi:hypothetical protein
MCNEIWRALQERLLALLRHSINNIFKKQKCTKQQRDRYFDTSKNKIQHDFDAI